MPSASFTTGKGYFNLSANQQSLIDYNYANYVDYDDDTRYDFSTWMMLKGNSEEVTSPEFYMWAGELNPRTGTLNHTTSYATDATNILVSSTNGIRVDDVLHFPVAGEDGEYVRVTSIGTDNVTVARLNTTASTLASDAAYTILGSASAETATSSIGSSFMEPAKVTNRVQLLRRAFEISDTEMATDIRTAVSRLNLKTDQCRRDFKIDLGMTMLFGATFEDTTNAFITSRGVNEILQDTSVPEVSSAGDIAYTDYSTIAEGLAQHSSSEEYVVLHGKKLLSGLAELGAGSSFFRTKADDTVFGFKGLTVCVGSFKFLHKYERLMDTAGSVYSGTAFILDVKTWTIHHLKNHKFKFQANIESDRGGEIRKSQFKAQIGLGTVWPKRNGLISGIT